jgi:Xaa-Pro aminopeptidase
MNEKPASWIPKSEDGGPDTLRTIVISTSLLAAFLFASAIASGSELQARRQRAAATFSDGILLVHARSAPDDETDGFRQDPLFYYFTGLENTAGAILAIDGRSRESWLFIPTHPLFWKLLPPEGSPESAAVRASGIEQVGDWAGLREFLTRASASQLPLYYIGDQDSQAELPPNITQQPAPTSGDGTSNPLVMPSWVALIANRWPSLHLTEARDRAYALMDVPSPSELVSLRAATRATVPSVIAGMRTVKPGASQRSVEWAMVEGCWQAGAHNAFWPWAMSGPNAVRPIFNASPTRYDHLDRIMKEGELVRLDDSCSVAHYESDLGRTVPVSGHFTAEQREIWDAFVAAYHAGANAIREGATVEQVFAAWQTELVRHRDSVTTALAREAIERWSKRENLDAFFVHTLTPNEGFASEPFRAGTAISFEPQASIHGQAFFMEDNFVITHIGTELLTPGMPYTADEIEAVMRAQVRK